MTKVAELETVFTADTGPFETKARKVEADRKALEKPVEVQVDADGASALSTMDRVASAARSVPDATVQVDADVSAANRALDDVADDAAAAGEKAGEGAGQGLAGGIIAALATIPVAGAVIGIGAAIGESIMDGLQVEVRADRLMAQTGLDPATVGTLARAAGEAYASNWGESIAANMDTARRAVQSGLLDPESTARDAEEVIGSLAGVADILEEDVSRVARSTATLMRTGLAKDSAAAFDIIVKGAQAGLNVSEDLLDTLDEYSTQFRTLGLDGPAALGLLSQAVRAGARDTDTAADALKEFAIRVQDGSTLTAESYAAIGLSAEEMAVKVTSGGEGATEALGLTLDKLREMEPGAARTAVAVGLFGTKAEDLGDALYAMDLDTAAEQLGTVAGAAKSAMDALGDNTAGQIASAQRNIEVAADGIKGALAAAFGPAIEDFATTVSENREAVIQFLLDVANGGLDAGRALVNAAADATEGFGDMVGAVGPQVLTLIEGILEGLERIPGVDLDIDGFRDMKADAEAAFESFDKGSSQAADLMRTNLIENGIDPAQEKLNEVGIPLVAQAALHDASVALASDLDSVGYAADGSKLTLESLNGVVDVSTQAGRALDGQLRKVVDGLDEQIDSGRRAGESQDELSKRYEEGRAALVRQLRAMGASKDEARRLADAYGAVPGKVDTIFEAETAAAQAEVDRFIARNQGKVIRMTAEVSTSGNQVYVTAAGTKLEKYGHVLQPMAVGGVTGSYLDPVAQMVPPNTLRVVGDRMDVDEAYIPLDGSARSRAIYAEAGARMGVGSGPTVARLASEDIDRLAAAIVRASSGAAGVALAEQARSAAGYRRTVGRVR